MLTSLDKRTLQTTWKLASPITNTIGDLFYKRLFELRPDLRASFPADLSALKKKFVTMLDFIVRRGVETTAFQAVRFERGWAADA